MAYSIGQHGRLYKAGDGERDWDCTSALSVHSDRTSPTRMLGDFGGMMGLIPRSFKS